MHGELLGNQIRRYGSLHYCARLRDIINRESIQERDRFSPVLPKPLGIETGEPFNPDDRQKRLLIEAALGSESIAKANDYFNPPAPSMILGAAWGRPDDNIDLAYGYLDGGNLEINSTHVAEVYYRLAINRYLAVTVDTQYMKDNTRHEKGPSGYILGLRGTARF